MPRMLDPDMQVLNTANGHFQFSGVRPEHLDATEYTLVSIVIDTTSSVSHFAKELLDTLVAVIDACRHSPRADYLLVRVTTFNNDSSEVHGYKLLNMIRPDAYQPFQCNGATALYDAAEDGIASLLSYAKTLTDQDFNANGIVFIITDGEDNSSRLANPKAIARLQQAAYRQEVLESLCTILVGVNAAHCRKSLQAFQKNAQLTQYIEVGAANGSALAKLANFVSQSIRTQSQALGSGGASIPLSF